MLGIKTIHQRVLDFIGVGQHVCGIETQNVGEVIYAGYVVILHARLNHVLPFASEPGMIEDPRQCRWAQLERSFQRFAIQNVVGSFSGRCGQCRIELLGVERISQCKFRTERPSLPLHRHRKRGRQIEPAHQRRRCGSPDSPGRFAQLQTLGRALERPVQRSISQLPLLTRDEKTWRVQNPDQFGLRKRRQPVFVTGCGMQTSKFW